MTAFVSTWWQRARDASWARPRGLLAVKTAFAAGLAWLLVQPLGGVADEYPYYAPMGAAVAMSTTVVGSLRTTVQSVGAIAIGAAVAVAVEVTGAPEPLAIGLTIAVATVVAGLRLLGAMGGWVLVAALFVLIIGGAHPQAYIAAYVGLTAFGALLATAVNALLPQLPLTPLARAQTRLRRSLAGGLDALAEGLTADRLLGEEDWEQLRHAIDPQVAQLRELMSQASEARRANWRAGRWSETADRRYAQARALERLSGCVDDVAELVSDQRASVHSDDETGAELRAAMAHAMQTVARMLRSADEDSTEEDAEPGPVQAAEEAVEELRSRVARIVTTSDQHLAASAVWVDLERAVEAWS